MSRLTDVVKKEDSSVKQYFVKHGLGAQYVANQTLGHYEDLEDKKGLPLDVYIELLEDSSIKKGLYFYVKGKLIGENKTTISKVYVIETDFLKKRINFQGFLKTFRFVDYGKTWASTRKELEDKKYETN